MQSESSLTQKTVKGLLWSFGDIITNQGIQFLVQIILARILLPEHFGVIGMVTVLMLISTIIIDSGFSQALIREQHVTQADYSTIFYFNLLIAAFLYAVLYLSAPWISIFFAEPELTLIVRVLSLGLFFNALGVIQSTLLIKSMDFKTRAKINTSSGILSGVIAIILAFAGFGVWSLVIRNLSLQFLYFVILCFYNHWKPSLSFNFVSFKKMFGFGSKLMLAGLISSIYSNVYNIVIGKMYSVTSLGYYTNAVKFSEAASHSISLALQRVTYPVLSSIQDESERLQYGFRKIIRLTAYIHFPLMIGLVVIAEPIIYVLFGEKWMPMVIYFQLLCIAGMLYPLQSIDLNILQVKGKSSLYLQVSIAKKVILTCLIIVSVWLGFGVIGLLVVLTIQSIIEFLMNSYFAGKEINYSTTAHMKDISLILLITGLMGGLVYGIGEVLADRYYLRVILQPLIGCTFYIGISKLTRIEEWKFLIDLIVPILKNRGKKDNTHVVNQ